MSHESYDEFFNTSCNRLVQNIISNFSKGYNRISLKHYDTTLSNKFKTKVLLKLLNSIFESHDISYINRNFNYSKFVYLFKKHYRYDLLSDIDKDLNPDIIDNYKIWIQSPLNEIIENRTNLDECEKFHALGYTLDNLRSGTIYARKYSSLMKYYNLDFKPINGIYGIINEYVDFIVDDNCKKIFLKPNPANVSYISYFEDNKWVAIYLVNGIIIEIPLVEEAFEVLPDYIKSFIVSRIRKRKTNILLKRIEK